MELKDFTNMRILLEEASPPFRVEMLLLAMDSLVQDFCFKSRCSPWAMSAENYPDLNDSLQSLSNTLCRIYATHGDRLRELGQASLPEELQKIQEETAALKQQLQDQEQTRDALLQSRDTLAELRKQAEQLRKVREELERNNDQIRSIDLPALKSTNQDLEKEKQQLERDLGNAESQEKELRGKAEAAARKKQELDVKIDAHNQLLSQLADVDAQIQTADTNLLNAQTALTAAMQKRDQLLAQLRAANTAAAMRQAQSKALTDQLTTASAEQDQAQKDFDALNTSLTEAKEQTQKLRDELGKTNDSIADEQREAEGLQQQIDDAKKLLQKQKNDVYSLQGDLERETKLNEDYRINTLEPAQKELKAAEDARDQQKQENDRLKGEQESLNTELLNIKSEIILRENDTEGLNRKINAANDELTVKTDEYNQTKSELQKIDALIASRANASEEMKKEIADKEQLLAKNDPVDMKAWYDSRNKELEEKRAKIAKLNENLAKQKEELDRAQEEHDGLLAKKAELDKNTQECNQELAKLDKQTIEDQYEKLQTNTKVLDDIRTRTLIAFRCIEGSDSSIPTVLKDDLTDTNSALAKRRSAINDSIAQLEKTISGE